MQRGRSHAEFLRRISLKCRATDDPAQTCPQPVTLLQLPQPSGEVPEGCVPRGINEHPHLSLGVHHWDSAAALTCFTTWQRVLGVDL